MSEPLTIRQTIAACRSALAASYPEVRFRFRVHSEIVRCGVPGFRFIEIDWAFGPDELQVGDALLHIQFDYTIRLTRLVDQAKPPEVDA